jgi:cbb3-type cytochrome oxidase subunit 3
MSAKLGILLILETFAHVPYSVMLLAIAMFLLLFIAVLNAPGNSSERDKDRYIEK